MKKFLKILGIFLGVVVLGVIGGIIYFNSSYPDVDPAPEVSVEATPERLARGEYLSNSVALCIDCHSERDWSTYTAPVVMGSEGKGGDVFDESMGMPGTIYAKNITPAAIGNWSDGELIRAITCGVNKDGEALFPMMPYLNFANLSQEDLYSIVAYIRTLKPIENKVGETELNFPMSLIVKTIPVKTYQPKEPVDRNNSIEYGKYLVTLASCSECHTQSEMGEPLPGMSFAGGAEFQAPWGIVRSANITPDNETGIGNWTRDHFINTFKHYSNDSSLAKLSGQDFNTIMPWTMYAGMTEEDLGAIYDYLRTLSPVKNQVVKHTPPNEIAAK